MSYYNPILLDRTIDSSPKDRIFIHLVIRRTENYLLHQTCEKDLSHRFYPKLERVLNTWDKYFSIPFWQLKRQIRDIALQDILSLGFDSIIPYFNVQMLSKINKAAGNHYIVPLDEDDWLHPNLVNTIREQTDKEQFPFMTWGTWKFSFFAWQPSIFKNEFFRVVASNAYAMKTPIIDVYALDNHLYFSELLQGHPEYNHYYLKPLGFKLDTPTSLITVIKGEGEKDPAKFIKIKCKDQIECLKNPQILEPIPKDFQLKLMAYKELLERAIK